MSHQTRLLGRLCVPSFSCPGPDLISPHLTSRNQLPITMMLHVSSPFSAAALLLLASTVAAGTIDSFISTERDIALKGVLANIGPNGTKVAGAGPGIVIASPSKSNPNYFYTWTRDAALTLKALVDDFMFGNTALQVYIEDYIHAQAVVQTVTNPSGGLLPAGTGLGEPKFNADGSRFNGNWGRPQRDGPPLRAIALIQYSHYLIQHGEQERVKKAIWPVISNDLSYVGQYWNSTGFDLWEEVSGSSFFTTQAQYRSLVEGAALAKSLGVVSCTGCGQAPQILCFLQTYWNGRYFTATINGNTGRGGVDANTVLGAIGAFDINAPCDSLTLQPCHSRMLANFKVFVDTFRNPNLYPINSGISPRSGVALGRYPEDVYYSGNPWYLITLGAAEFLYDAAAQWSKQGAITVDITSLAFFQDLYPGVEANRTYKRCKKTGAFRQIVDAAIAYADSFVEVVQKYTPTDGSLAEQFLKIAPGTPLSAADLTWSYASFVSMAHRRGGEFPPSWVFGESTTLPETCAPGSVASTYAPATAAGAPNVTIGCTSTVLFVLNATTYYGENIYLAGNSTDLGGWDLGSAVPMQSSNYTAERPLWFEQIPLVAGTTVNYKYAREEDCGQPWIWETVNRTLVVPACVENSTAVLLETDEAWTGLLGTGGGC
ncbi:Six-hairpin glycosidase-like protein [Apodospora peruviana]|uniref:Glucoamylase n=1 Tax=Apodospora peruviana TaxID=516989 RepID=A0AAE0I4A1_9PEZI|nr:Six-hairpin glycosidase-like protein [Apodospora peruviana]